MGSTSHNHYQLVYDNNQLWNHLQTWQTCPSRRKRWSRLSSQLPPPPPSSPPRSLAAASSSSWSWSCSGWWWWWWCCCQWSSQGAVVGHRAKPQSYGRSVSFPEARERERGRKTEGNSRFTLLLSLYTCAYIYTAPYWCRRIVGGAYCFLLVVSMLQFPFLLQNQNSFPRCSTLHASLAIFWCIPISNFSLKVVLSTQT